MPIIICRRTFLQVWGTSASSLAFALDAQAEAKIGPPKTYVYKTVGDCHIKADVYAPPGGKDRPVVVWIHGGALIMGSRGGIDRSLVEALVNTGYVVVSIDYRLAPESKLPAILEDVVDACRWVRQQGPRLFHIDPGKLAVAGGSAGGYLTLVTGYLIEPRPRALVAFWGYGDIAGSWYSRPSSFYRLQPLVSEAAARSSVGSKMIADGSGTNRRGRFYLYCRQQGLWPREVAGHDPDTEPRAFDPFCPLRNVTPAYPPTLLVHGTADTDVPYEQSELMDRELARKGVPHELITVPGAGHGLSGARPAELARVQKRVLAFLASRLEVV